MLMVEGLPTTMQPYAENGRWSSSTWRTGRFAAVCERGLKGVVAKRERDPYRSGVRA